MPHPHDAETLDPDDWDALRDLGHRMVDDSVAFLRGVRERPVWQPTPAALRQRFNAPLPREGAGLEGAYEAYKRDVATHPLGNVHPRFWGWVAGSGTPGAALAELLAGTINSSAAGFDCSATLVEEQVVRWLRDMLGFPEGTSGLLPSSCSMATLTGLAIARHVKSDFDVARLGMHGAPKAPVLYASTETHSSVRRAVELLGWGSDALRLIPVDAERRLRVDLLEREIARHRMAGYAPVAVVGTAGTVNTGAVDDLDALADVCEREDLWLHVDGAFGATGWLCEELRPTLRGLQRADSLAFDLHKWMQMPFAVGCCLFRSREEALATFGDGSSYLAHMRGGPRGYPRWFGDEGPELTRPARALKVWMSLIEHGTERFAHVVSKNVAQARHLERRVVEHPQLELLGAGPLSVLCFRYTRPGLDDAALNELNDQILFTVQESGLAVPSHTVLEGRFALRVAITNHRTRQEDLDLFLDRVVDIGDELTQQTMQTGGSAAQGAES
jgi:glutamate/tyrosine decarboxylase-like PLP-dependent enzyme